VTIKLRRDRIAGHEFGARQFGFNAKLLPKCATGYREKMEA
jgi:hypothetical protein